MMSGRYEELRALGADVVLPEGDALRTAALEVICSEGVPSYLTPYGSVRSIAAFAIGAKDDPFYNDGEALLRAALRRREENPAKAQHEGSKR